MKKLLETALTAMFLCASATAVVGQPEQSAVSSCNRACLLRIADAYLAALVAHDPAKAPMAPNARFTEQDPRDRSDGPVAAALLKERLE